MAKHNETKPGIVKTRGNKPSLLKRNQGEPFGWIWLQPISEVHAPIKVWAHRTPAGWEGWISALIESKAGDTMPAKTLLPTQWSKTIWKAASIGKKAG